MFLLGLPIFTDPAKALARAQERAERALSRALPFDQIKPPRADAMGGDVGVKAGTFRPTNPLESIFPDVQPGENHALYSPSGRLRYERRHLPRGYGLPITDSPDWGDCGRVHFDEDLLIPVLSFTREWAGTPQWTPWMSLTPMEIWSQRSGIRAATGHVVLGGLGMGWLLSEIVKKPSVKSVLVVEKDQDLVDWFGGRLVGPMSKVTGLVVGDVFELAAKPYYFDKDARFILDVWASHGEARWDRRLKALRATGAKCWAWGSPRGGA